MNAPIVRDWMTRQPVLIEPTTSVYAAHRLMTEKRVRRLPVVLENKLVGIVTLGDIRAAEPSGATTLSRAEMLTLLDELKVDKIMTRHITTVSPTTPIREAAGIMLVHKISGLPVVENDQVVGIITESDIFRMLVRNMESVMQ